MGNNVLVISVQRRVSDTLVLLGAPVLGAVPDAPVLNVEVRATVLTVGLGAMAIRADLGALVKTVVPGAMAVVADVGALVLTVLLGVPAIRVEVGATGQAVPPAATGPSVAATASVTGAPGHAMVIIAGAAATRWSRQ